MCVCCAGDKYDEMQGAAPVTEEEDEDLGGLQEGEGLERQVQGYEGRGGHHLGNSKHSGCTGVQPAVEGTVYMLWCWDTLAQSCPIYFKSSLI